MILGIHLSGSHLLILGYLVVSVVSKGITEPVLLVHGGAGTFNSNNLGEVYAGVKRAARIGFATMQTAFATTNVLNGVQEAIRAMEKDPQFNAGYGSVLTWEGKVEMDAALMNGSNLAAGCVSVAQNIYHPIDLARRIMEKTRHTYLAGDGAMAFADEENFEILPEGTLVTEKTRKALEDYKNSLNATTRHLCECNTEYGSPGTVGAVAIDEYGNVAAATSTGGMIGKMPGRIGDSPLLGAGTYADNTMGAVSATGHGETIMRFNVASRILYAMMYEQLPAQEATEKVLNEMTRRSAQAAGVVSVDKYGNLGIYFTTPHMAWAFQRGDELHYGVRKDEHFVEIVGEPRLDQLDSEED